MWDEVKHMANYTRTEESGGMLPSLCYFQLLGHCLQQTASSPGAEPEGPPAVRAPAYALVTT